MVRNSKERKTDPSDYTVDAPPADLPEGQITQTGFFYQLRFLWAALMRSPSRNSLFLSFFIIFVLICLIAYGLFIVNKWTKDFWDTIGARDLGGFIWQLGVFCLIAGGLLVLNVLQSFFNQFFKMKLREGLTDDLIHQWLRPKRAYRLKLAGEIGVNPDQRLHEDARHLAEATADLSINLLQAGIISITFIRVLWQTSEGFVFNVNGYSFPLPGYMVWAVILYVGSASFLTWFVGRRLVTFNANRYAKEAELRATLMRVNQNIEAVTLAGGEKNEQKQLDHKVDDVLAAIWRIVLSLTRLTGVTAAYGWISNIAPAVIAAPIYFGGGINLGGLMQAVNSFNLAHNSLRWFVDNYGALADWRATMLRISTFRQALLRMDELDQPHEGRIMLGINKKRSFSFTNLTVETANGAIKFNRTKISVSGGEHVAFVCGKGVDCSILFKAIGGLWPWGRGDIAFPAEAKLAYLPWTTSLPRASLRAALLYPGSDKPTHDVDIAKVLAAVGLKHFADMLDREAEWDKILDENEKQCLAFARTILAKPDIVIIENVLDVLETAMRRQIKTAIRRYLDRAICINITNRQSHDDFFTHKISVRFHSNPAK